MEFKTSNVRLYDLSTHIDLDTIHYPQSKFFVFKFPLNIEIEDLSFYHMLGGMLIFNSHNNGNKMISLNQRKKKTKKIKRKREEKFSIIGGRRTMRLCLSMLSLTSFSFIKVPNPQYSLQITPKLYDIILG